MNAAGGVKMGDAKTRIPNVTDDISPGRSYLVNGVCLLVVLFFLPGGLAGALRRLSAVARRRLART